MTVNEIKPNTLCLEAIKFFEDCKHHCDNREYHDMAISALEKQIPKKPLIRYENMGWGISPNETFKIKGCPCCKEDIYEETNCCPNCGQKLDWTEGEEA